MESVKQFRQAMHDAKDAFCSAHPGMTLRDGIRLQTKEALRYVDCKHDEYVHVSRLLKAKYEQELVEFVQVMDRKAIRDAAAQLFNTSIEGSCRQDGLEEKESHHCIDDVDDDPIAALQATADIDLGDVKGAQTYLLGLQLDSDDAVDEEDGIMDVVNIANSDGSVDEDEDEDENSLADEDEEKDSSTVVNKDDTADTNDAADTDSSALSSASTQTQRIARPVQPYVQLPAYVRTVAQVNTLQALLGKTDSLLPMSTFVGFICDGHLDPGKFKRTVHSVDAGDYVNSCEICGHSEDDPRRMPLHRLQCAKMAHIHQWMQIHPLTLASIQPMAERDTTASTGQTQLCPWDQGKTKGRSCSKFNEIADNPFQVIRHLHNTHVNLRRNIDNKKKHDQRCPYANCAFLGPDMLEMYIHLELKHIVFCADQEAKSCQQAIERCTYYCFACGEFITLRSEWRQHCLLHKIWLNTAPEEARYLPVLNGQSIEAPGYCPWCVHDDSKPAEESMKQ